MITTYHCWMLDYDCDDGDHGHGYVIQKCAPCIGCIALESQSIRPDMEVKCTTI